MSIRNRKDLQNIAIFIVIMMHLLGLCYAEIVCQYCGVAEVYLFSRLGMGANTSLREITCRLS